jgi:hypothetical protein
MVLHGELRLVTVLQVLADGKQQARDNRIEFIALRELTSVRMAFAHSFARMRDLTDLG